MVNHRKCILGLLWLACFVNGLQMDRMQLSTRQMAAIRSSVKLRSKVDDGDNEMRKDQLSVESSSKVLSKYETRSKLLEAALMSSRSRESKVDAENVRLINEIAKINQTMYVSEKNNLQQTSLLETTKANLFESLKESSADVARLEKELEMSRNENVAEVVKYRNRLTLMENAYRESQVKNRESEQNYDLEVKTLEALIAKLNEEKLSDQIMRENYMENNKRKQTVMKKALEEGKDRIEESIRLHDADQILIAELRYQVEQLQIELEVRRQDLIIQRDAMNSERERSENERTENNRLETKRIEELKMKIEESLKIKNEQSDERRKVDRSETFIEFYNKNIEASKARDEQIEQEKKNEIFLKQQQILLDEAVRVPSIPSVGKSQDDKPSEVDVNFAGQIRSLKEQVKVLESLTVQIITASSTLASRVESASEILKNDEMTMDQNEINVKKEISVKSDGVSRASKIDSSDKREEAESRSVKRAYQQSNEELRSRKEEKEKEEDVNLEDSISSFFTNVMNNISGQDKVKSDINNTTNPEKKKKQRIKLGSAQQKRVDLARQSGQAIRDMSGAMAKTAADTLGFWVGLGYDELEVEDEGRDNKRLGERDGVRSDFNQRSNRFEDYRSSSKIDDIRLGEEDIRAADYSPRVSDEEPDGSWTLPFSVGDDVYSKSLDSPAVDDNAEVPLEMPFRGLDGRQMGVEETEDTRFMTSEDDQINNDKLTN